MKERARSLVTDDKHAQEMVGVRKEDLKECARSLVADLRNSVILEGKTTSELTLRFDRLEKKLVTDCCGQTAVWYNDNVKYKGVFQVLLLTVLVVRTEVHDINRVLCKSLAALSEGGSEVSQSGATATSGTVTPEGSSRPTSDKVTQETVFTVWNTDLKITTTVFGPDLSTRTRHINVQKTLHHHSTWLMTHRPNRPDGQPSGG